MLIKNWIKPACTSPSHIESKKCLGQHALLIRAEAGLLLWQSWLSCSITFMFWKYYSWWCFMISVCEWVDVRNISRGAAEISASEKKFSKCSWHHELSRMKLELLFHCVWQPQGILYSFLCFVFLKPLTLWQGGAIFLFLIRALGLVWQPPPLLRFPAISWSSLQEYSSAISCLHCLNSLSAEMKIDLVFGTN